MSADETAEGLHGELVRIVGEVEGLDMRALEGEPVNVIYEALYPPIEHSVGESLALMRRVLERYEGASLPPPPSEPRETGDWGRDFDLGVDEIVKQYPSPGRVADLGFMATIELKQKAAVLERLAPSGDPWQLLSILDSARRRVRKSLTAVGTILCQCEGLESNVDFASELARSLEVRKLYARLRGSIDEANEPADDEVLRRLRGVGTRIAIVVGHIVYADLRVDDRAQLRSLQDRILAWLRGHDPEDGSSLIEGRRLWQDLAGFARVLALVSLRQELIEHDAHVVAIAHGTLSSRPELPERLVERLSTLRGLDDEVDSLLREDVTETQRWREPLDRLKARFNRGGDPSGGAGFGEGFEFQ